MFGRAAGGDQHLIDVQRLAVDQRRRAARRRGLLDARRQRSRSRNVTPARAISSRRPSRMSSSKPRRILPPRIDLRHLGAEPPEERGELDRDIAAADHQQAARKLGEVEDLVRGDRVLEPATSGCSSGAPPVATRMCARRNPRPVGERDLVRPDDDGALASTISTPALRDWRVDAGEAGDLLLLGARRASASRSAVSPTRPAEARRRRAKSSAKRLA